MSRNIEIKARCHSPQTVQQLLDELFGSPNEQIAQSDTFFSVSNGRLKLRDKGPSGCELIFYRRENVFGPKTSYYQITPIADRDSALVLLENLFPVGLTLKKTRQVFLAGRTRIHFDHVEGLGHFLELEVVLAEGDTEASGTLEAHQWIARLGIAEKDLVNVAYVDLLAVTDTRQLENPTFQDESGAEWRLLD